MESNMYKSLKALLISSALTIAGGAVAYADDAAPAAAADQPAAPAGPTLAPSMTGIAANANPFSVDLSGMPVLGELFGKTYITGALSGIGQYTSNHVPADRETVGDLSNAQVIVQKVDGWFQYYVQAGVYSFPYIGGPYVKASPNTSANFGPFPVAYAKIAPTSNFSIQAGKLPTLIGNEYNFTFQNMDIQRGLLWAQEPAVSNGVQVNYTAGPLALSLAFTDGLYSGRWNTLSGAAIWTINTANVLAFSVSAPLSKNYKNSGATFVLQNNQDIYNLIYTFTSGPLTISPYVQYQHIHALPAIGLTKSTSVWGAAVLAKYAFNSNFSLDGRVEYIDENGSAAAGSADPIGYGPGSNAWSLTLTPTYQYNVYFLRVEASYIHASNEVFGETFNHKDQFRAVAETGIAF
jgi:hypothetical protein